MAKNLVIVESPAKAKTIEKFLGKEFKVASSFGHIADLPSKELGVDVEGDFLPKYIVSSDKKKVVSELKSLAKKADTVWLASDEDREGEAIAWHLANTLELKETNTKRIVFHEITKNAILKAIDAPREIDYNLVNAQQARRVLDRLVGYELSPVLWRKVKGGLDLDYLHITTNNTIFGTQFHDLPQTNVPLIADMSSDIFSREFDYSAFDLFYAGSQKNMGPAGTTLVIVKDSLLEKMNKDVPSMLSYATHADKGSMFNTPPVFAVYTSMLTLEWLKEKGGISAIQEHNINKAKLIYDEIDRNSAFEGFAAKEDRSFMNATFNLAEGVDGAAFDDMWNAANISGLKGHRSVGGYRASIYNALPLESAQQLVDVMQQFEKTL